LLLVLAPAPISVDFPLIWRGREEGFCCGPEIHEIDPAEQTRRRLGQKDLTAMTDGHHRAARLSTVPK
jgi:hypothetical protein